MEPGGSLRGGIDRLADCRLLQCGADMEAEVGVEVEVEVQSSIVDNG